MQSIAYLNEPRVNIESLLINILKNKTTTISIIARQSNNNTLILEVNFDPEICREYILLYDPNNNVHIPLQTLVIKHSAFLTP